MSRKLLGVVIARFQTPILTPAHCYLLEQVATRSGRVLILLGTAPVPLTKRNPLDVSLRMQMVHDWWSGQFPSGPELLAIPLYDRPTDEEWASQADQAIGAVAVGCPVTLFCGPDGAGPLYTKAGGRHRVEMLDSAGGHASRVREELLPRHTEDFRAGMIYALERKMHGPFMTVDAIIRSVDFRQILLARKREDGQYWRLVGGFVDVRDASLEAAVIREAREETGLEVGNVSYLGTHPVDDWRYKGGPETILTGLFQMDTIFGTPNAKDDIDDLMWIPPTDVDGCIHPIHKPLWGLYMATQA